MAEPGHRRLLAPRLRRGIIARPRVEQVFDRGWEALLTLVVAPPGYGKTVSVETWISNRGHVAAWVPIEPGDNDAVELWTSVAAAVEHARPGLGRDALDRLGSEADVARPAIDALAGALAEDGRPLVLVLDNLQLVEDEQSLHSLDIGLDALPDTVHLIAISRAAPRLRVARLRSHGQLVELQAPDLAFTVGEARELFAAVEGVSADEASVAALTARTEGWPAALYLAALWLRERGESDESLRAFRGSNRLVSDYLTREVLAGLDADTLDFLVRTSVLVALSGELCDATLETTGSLDRLRELERSNLLVIELADRPGSYRYHSLLRDYLASELNARDPGAISVLRRRALTWCLEHGAIEEAAEYARAAGDWEALVGLVETHQFTLLRTGRRGTLARWSAAIPRDVLMAHPSAMVSAVLTAHAVGRPAPEIRRLIALARAAGLTDPSRRDAQDAAGLQVVLAIYTDQDVGRAHAAAWAAVELAGEDGVLRVAALAILALTALLAGDEKTAGDAARAGLAHPDAAKRPFGYIGAASVLAILDARAGRPNLARSHADLALAMTREAGLSGRVSDSRAHLADAVAAELEGRLAHAQRAAARAVRTSIHGGAWHAWALLELTRIALGRGRVADAERALAHATELLSVSEDPGQLEAAAAQLQAILDRARVTTAAPPAELPSPAELAVLRLLPQRTVREVADALFLSANTVKSHIRSIYLKLGVKTRDEAISRALSLGLIDERDALR